MRLIFGENKKAYCALRSPAPTAAFWCSHGLEMILPVRHILFASLPRIVRSPEDFVLFGRDPPLSISTHESHCRSGGTATVEIGTVLLDQEFAIPFVKAFDDRPGGIKCFT